jgi:hypothetical protein
MARKKKEPAYHPERDWHVSFLSSVLGEFDSKTEDGTLYWQDYGVDYAKGHVKLCPTSGEEWQKAYTIYGYCKYNNIDCSFDAAGPYINDGH